MSDKIRSPFTSQLAKQTPSQGDNANGYDVAPFSSHPNEGFPRKIMDKILGKPKPAKMVTTPMNNLVKGT